MDVRALSTLRAEPNSTLNSSFKGTCFYECQLLLLLRCRMKQREMDSMEGFLADEANQTMDSKCRGCIKRSDIGLYACPSVIKQGSARITAERFSGESTIGTQY